MEEVANVFSHSILRTVEEDAILSYINGPDKYASVYNMDQTAVYIDMNGRTTVDFVGAQTGDVVQESAINVFRVSVFLAASATEVFNPAFGAAAAEHTVQKNAYCDATVMLDWIERVWKPSVDGLFSSTEADAKACTTAGSVWNYKFDTTTIIWRAFARYFMISDFPDCLFYREKCFTETLCGESSKGSPPHYQICAGPTAFSPHTVALHLAAYRQTSKMNPADRLIIVLLMEMLSGDTSAPAAASNLLNQAHELEVAFVTGLLAPQHREWLAKERSGHWAHMLFSSRLYFDSSMKELFRMDSSSIAALFKAVCPGMVPTRDAPDAVVPPKRLAVFLYVCAHGSSVRVTADKFAIGPATVSVIVKDLAAIVCSLLSSLVAFPPFRLCASHFARSADCKWPGRVGDSRVFRNSELARCFPTISAEAETVSILTGAESCARIPYFLLGDSGYQNMQYMVTTFEIAETEADAVIASLNKRLSNARYRVECAFGRLKCRWRILLKGIGQDISAAPDIVYALCIIQNFLLDRKDTFHFTPEEQQQILRKYEVRFPQPETEFEAAASGNTRNELKKWFVFKTNTAT
ncbi:hypothetical protein PF005_g17012 [Phytophthora fragariae]|uniref:DDE Tnp4 domain-containing protein n=1 Tax=Phytophthora fragariae TaxID=53985 RepID=A0A6A3XDM7_9STRA|nr:hypothetical protein PF005_g17012 [Phytophthora fragariae]